MAQASSSLVISYSTRTTPTVVLTVQIGRNVVLSKLHGRGYNGFLNFKYRECSAIRLIPKYLEGLP